MRSASTLPPAGAGDRVDGRRRHCKRGEPVLDFPSRGFAATQSGNQWRLTPLGTSVALRLPLRATARVADARMKRSALKGATFLVCRKTAGLERTGTPGDE